MRERDSFAPWHERGDPPHDSHDTAVGPENGYLSVRRNRYAWV
jgi:hypothetical protein